MKERWVNSPEVLKGNVIKRIGIGLLLSVIGIIFWALFKQFLFALPCFVISAVLIINGASVLFASLTSR